MNGWLRTLVIAGEIGLALLVLIVLGGIGALVFLIFKAIV